MKINRYIEDILAQPEALRETVARYSPDSVAPIAEAVRSQQYDRIILSGMGSSHFAGYPAWLNLVRQGLPAWSLTAGELLYFAPSLVTGNTLLWLTSQSGASAEVQALVEQLAPHRPGAILGTTAHEDSPLGRAADAILQLHIGDEFTVSTGSYLTTLAVQQLAVTQIAAEDVGHARQELQQAAAGLADYLAGWRRQVQQWETLVGAAQRLYFVGRGPSLAAVKTGSLIVKESAKFPVEGMSAAQFRHGPLELADERLAVVVFAGPEETRALNEQLAGELQAYGASVIWLAASEHATLPTVLLPALPASALPIAEMIPIQLLSLALASLTGVEPGIFRHIGKVTRTL